MRSRASRWPPVPAPLACAFTTKCYAALGLDDVDKAFTADLSAAVAGIRALRMRGCGLQPQTTDLDADLLVNVTPLSVAGRPEASELAFAPATVAPAQVVSDVVALIQALEQVVRYTGVRPGSDAGGS